MPRRFSARTTISVSVRSSGISSTSESVAIVLLSFGTAAATRAPSSGRPSCSTVIDATPARSVAATSRRSARVVTSPVVGDVMSTEAPGGRTGARTRSPRSLAATVSGSFRILAYDDSGQMLRARRDSTTICVMSAPPSVPT